MAHITELTIRRINFDKKDYWLTTQSGKLADKMWSNCLYLHFIKEKFPLIKSPPLKESPYGGDRRCFDYYESVLGDLGWHGGITFYEEVVSVESGRTVVKVGCDYQHYMDDAYMTGDYGKIIIEEDGPRIVRKFEELYSTLEFT